MKPQPTRYSIHDRERGDFRFGPHRRYPSLSEDFPPDVRRPPLTPRSITTSAGDEGLPSGSNRVPFPSVRVIALLAIIGVLAVLVAAGE